MADGDGIEKKTRILPPWMLGVTAPDHEGKGFKNVNCKNNNTLKVGPKSRTSYGENIAEFRDQKTKTRRRKGSNKPCNIDGDGGMLVAVDSEVKEETEKMVRCSTYEREEGEVDEDEDLTVDDLLSIAKEFMRCHNNLISGPQPPSQKYTAEAEIAETVGVSAAETTAGFTQGVTGKDCSGAEDHARDMLELFIGPLLKKPSEDHNKVLSHIKCDGVLRDAELPQKISAEEGVKLKNKSSLRDKVAALLE